MALKPGRKPRSDIPAWALSGACAAFAVAGLCYLTAYSQTSGELLAPATQPVRYHRYTLAVAVHPRCPCTRATLYELDRLLARCSGKLDAIVYVYRPQNAAPGWGASEIRDWAARSPGVSVVDDPGAHLAAAFGARTSGSVVLYDTRGNARFWGGITRARGHAGDNLGSDAVKSIVDGRADSATPTEVFGCILLGPDELACCPEPRP